ncbi:cAMP-binding domain of CRP or a regulatory subunit of cAMP-dependent protein kinases [Flexibacter flexilis DSM 6793]|uniref:cAMP-binding domain of CRP or a regulatory subunit of cAMP-dependent protein kinases n=1 Tax=Flexibacter flexilis DSM 6793 TaxID=927664 RepID=A0A1I1IT89_9BACT|nr:Crp/Fnr family transcriptional regulator [Flexibacter flexilis]SFC36953.1 cAMP-binding domain of CRP or a regulatory subunit of cAMP-dependent protein kinases [Flexibacter flexilis DSM 6793]
MIEALFLNISRHISSSPADIKQFCDLFSFQQIHKKEFLLRKGEVCKFEAFVTKGLFKVYHIDAKGTEQILYFGMEDWWITDIDSFMNQEPSRLFIEAIEDSEIWLISKKDKDFAYEHYPIVEKLFRIMTQKTHTALQRRVIDNMSKTAEQRYWEFMEKYPSLGQRLTNIQIAAYLGISHEFLSKIRRKAARPRPNS